MIIIIIFNSGFIPYGNTTIEEEKSNKKKKYF